MGVIEQTPRNWSTSEANILLLKLAWVPTCVGMTVISRRAIRPTTVMPAQAGTHASLHKHSGGALAWPAIRGRLSTQNWISK